jgi:hypothetical protein
MGKVDLFLATDVVVVTGAHNDVVGRIWGRQGPRG